MDQLLLGTLEDLLLECVDALECPGHDCSDRGAHFTAIANILKTDIPTEAQRLTLGAVQEVFERHSRMEACDFMFRRQPRNEADLIAEIRKAIPKARQFLYHGTVHKRLAGIALEGFRSGKEQVWRGQVEDDYLKSAVFFSTSWRSALNWAQVAHSRARGRKDSISRKPTVLRIRIGDLTVESDTRALSPGSVMVKGGHTSAAGAQFFLGTPRGIPAWDDLITARI